MKQVHFITAIAWLAVNIAKAEVGFNKDVLPIFAEKCFVCHGMDGVKRKAGLRLDEQESAYAERNGVRAVVPGDLKKSALISRIFSKDVDFVMPPSDEVPLTESEKTRLKEWIGEGANYEKHWAFQEPKKAKLPYRQDWGHNEIDRFIFERLAKAGLEPKKQATKESLIRRVSFDLTGLPPAVDQIDLFLNDVSADAYEKVVDRLLDSPRFGERMAVWWLDGARYADSHGYDNDLENSQWPWRDWVIESFNANKPYDEFTVEQLAGDLLLNPTQSQVLATGFNRNHRINTEGGAIDEEWRTEYVIDRVQAMGTVWMGLTLSCARCHDHKYDPISQKEFYQIFAMFNNLDEKGFINNLRGSADPRIRYKTREYQSEVRAIAAKFENKDERKKAIANLDSTYPWVMVMLEMEKPRKAFVLDRGQYDAPIEEVQAGLPAAFSPAPRGMKMNRLALAHWLVDRRHPLTARVVVNRLWEQVFGLGIVESSENLGVQTDWPSHPELLDWLAVDFVEHG